MLYLIYNKSLFICDLSESVNLCARSTLIFLNRPQENQVAAQLQLHQETISSAWLEKDTKT